MNITLSGKQRWYIRIATAAGLFALVLFSRDCEWRYRDVYCENWNERIGLFGLIGVYVLCLAVVLGLERLRWQHVTYLFTDEKTPPH